MWCVVFVCSVFVFCAFGYVVCLRCVVFAFVVVVVVGCCVCVCLLLSFVVVVVRCVIVCCVSVVFDVCSIPNKPNNQAAARGAT